MLNFIFWFIYSIFGWIIETLYTSILNMKWQDRGFLSIPIIPIYGFGAMISIVLISPITTNKILIFIYAFFLTSLLEYVTSYIMEKAFNMRWWDYSKQKFNINGRVCLKNSLMFGALSLILINYIHPQIIKYVNMINTNVLYYLSIIIFIIVSIDFIHAILFSLKYSQVSFELDKFEKYYLDNKEELLLKVNNRISEISNKVDKLEHRILSKYPILKEKLLQRIEKIKANITILK